MFNYHDRIVELDNRTTAPGTSVEELHDIDKWQVARHEAAHIVAAAMHYNVLWGAEIQTNGIDYGSIWNKGSWFGQASGRTLGDCERSEVVAVAGVAGVHLISEPDIDGLELAEFLDLDMFQMSNSDKAGLPAGFGEQVQAFDAALETLRTNREVWDMISLELYHHEAICTEVVQAFWLGMIAPSDCEANSYV